MRPRTALSGAALALASGLLLTGCSATVPMTAAPDAASPACAEVTVRFPGAIDVFPKRYTDAQATGAWGDPAVILLRCGVPVPGPSTLPCISLEGIDWLRDDSEDPIYVFTTYGRTPAVEVIVDSRVASGTNALNALNNAVSRLPVTGACTDPLVP